MKKRLLAVIVLLCPVSSGAQPAEVQRLLREGNQLVKRGDCIPAASKFREALRLYPEGYRLEVNIGSALECAGQLPQAARRFEAFLRRSDPIGDRRMRRAVERRLGALRRKLGSLDLRCRVSGATVTVNDGVVGTTPIEGLLYLNPGSCRLAVSKPGHRLYQWQGRLDAGETRRVEVILPPRSSPPARPTTLPSVATAAKLRPERTTRPEKLATLPNRPGSVPWYRRWWIWTIAGAVVAGAVTAVVVTQTGGSDRLPEGEAGRISFP
jgi:hypothetical protein